MQEILTASEASNPAWLEVVRILIPALATVTVAWLGAPWLRERLAARKIAETTPLNSPVVAPQDPLVIRLIEGLQADLARARRLETKLTAQRIMDVEQIARLNAELEDAEERTSQVRADLASTRSEKIEIIKELVELRASVNELQIYIRSLLPTPRPAPDDTTREVTS